MKVASWLEQHPLVKKVYYPGLESHPQHELMKQQQKGNSGLLSFVIDGTTEQAKKIADSLKIFKIGCSWGGFESLVMMPYARHTEEECEFYGVVPGIIRIHCGLEGVDALIGDLEQAFATLQ